MGNPIIPGKGVCDPHIHVFGGRAYLYATHDADIANTRFVMHDWWIWSSADLFEWRHECTLSPEETCLRAPRIDCWATDAAERGARYYWYLSTGPRSIAVMEADSPAGPWRDPLGKPLIAEGSTPSPGARDPAIFKDDDGAVYIVFGVWDFYIARLQENMVALAEKPRKIVLDRNFGPYGEGKTDDKPSLHKHNGIYYLSWGCFYAIGASPHGPYEFKGAVIARESVAEDFRDVKLAQGKAPAIAPDNLLFHDRHGNFFEMNGQWYFVCNDMSQPGSTNRFRSSCLSYLHYRDDGAMEPVTLDRTGVGEYDAGAPRIEAENFGQMHRLGKRQCPSGGFELRDIRDGSWAIYPRVHNLASQTTLTFRAASGHPGGALIEVRQGDARGKLLGSCVAPCTGGWDKYATMKTGLANRAGTLDLCLLFRGNTGEILRLDWFAFNSDAR